MKQKNKMKYFCISVVSVCTVIVIWFSVYQCISYEIRNSISGTGKSIQYVLR